jgi:hypothetical protein
MDGVEFVDAFDEDETEDAGVTEAADGVVEDEEAEEVGEGDLKD